MGSSLLFRRSRALSTVQLVWEPQLWRRTLSRAFAFPTRILAKHGTMVVVGLPKEPIPFHYADIIFRDMQITSGTPCQKTRLQEMIDLTVSAKIHVEVKVYAGLESLPVVIKDYHDPNIKGKLVVKIG
jgi:D-arabinose 1-dehydrogenase-like Zn-dependent alcohol dehydrogenase